MSERDPRLWGRCKIDSHIALVEEILEKSYRNPESHPKYQFTEVEYKKILPRVDSIVTRYSFVSEGKSISAINFQELNRQNFLAVELMGHQGLPFSLADEIRDALDYVR